MFVSNRADGKIGFIDWLDVHLVWAGDLHTVHAKEMSDAWREHVGLERLVAQKEDLLVYRNELWVNKKKQDVVLHVREADRAPSGGWNWLETWSRGG